MVCLLADKSILGTIAFFGVIKAGGTITPCRPMDKTRKKTRGFHVQRCSVNDSFFANLFAHSGEITSSKSPPLSCGPAAELLRQVNDSGTKTIIADKRLVPTAAAAAEKSDCVQVRTDQKKQRRCNLRTTLQGDPYYQGRKGSNVALSLQCYLSF